MALPVYESASAVVVRDPGVVGTVSSITLDKPSGTVSGDGLYAVVELYDSSSVTSTPPAGWSTIAGPIRSPSGNLVSMYVFRKIAGGSEGANYTFSISQSRYTVGFIFRVSGVDGTTPEDGTPTTNSAASGTTRTGTGLTTSGADRLLALITGGYNGAPNSTPSGMTSRVTFDGQGGLWTQSFTSAGSTGNKTHTQDVSDSWVAVLVAIASPAASGYTLTAAQGSVSVSGQPATLRAVRQLSAAQGAVSVSGQTAGLKRVYPLTAAQGSVTLSGQTATLRRILRLTATQGAIIVSGQDATLTAPGGGPTTYTLTAAQGAASVAGQAAVLRKVYKVAAAQGAVSVTGQAVTLQLTRRVLAAEGAVAISGQAALLRANRKLVAAQGSVTVAGQAATLFRGRFLTAAMGAVTVSGQAATLRVPIRRLSAAPGVIAIAGFAATLSVRSASGWTPVVGDADVWTGQIGDTDTWTRQAGSAGAWN